MYADKITKSMKRALDETDRRRAKQVAHNEKYGIQPISIMKAVRDITKELSSAERLVAETQGAYNASDAAQMPKSELKRIIIHVEKAMKEAATNLEFEKAALLRDQLFEMRQTLADELNLPPWDRVKLMAGEE